MEHVAGVAHGARPRPARVVRLSGIGRKASQVTAPVTFSVVAHVRSPFRANRQPGSPLPRPVAPRNGGPTSAAASCAPRSTSSRRAATTSTSVEDIVRSARTSRTAFYAFFDNREDAMYGALQTSLRGLLDTCGRRSSSPGPTTISSRSAIARVRRLPRRRSRRRRDHPARRRRHVTRGQRAASRIRREIADLIRDLWAEYDPQAAAAPASARDLGRRVRHPLRVDGAPRRDEPARRGAGTRPALVDRDRACLRAPSLALGA